MPKPEKLSRREREIMDALFASPDGASAEDVRARLIDPPSYSAVRTMLARLEDKGPIRHREEGLRYVYVPTTTRTGCAAGRPAADRAHLLRRIAGANGHGTPETREMDG